MMWRELQTRLKKEKFMEDLEKVTHAGMFNIIEWTIYISKDGTVTLTADMHDSIAGGYIEVLGTVSDSILIEQFEDEVRNGMKPLTIC